MAASTPCATPAASCACVCASAGRPNARVLPDPVAATPMTSRPAQATGQVSIWIGDGTAKSRVTCSRSAAKPVGKSKIRLTELSDRPVGGFRTVYGCSDCAWSRCGCAASLTSRYKCLARALCTPVYLMRCQETTALNSRHPDPRQAALCLWRRRHHRTAHRWSHGRQRCHARWRQIIVAHAEECTSVVFAPAW